MGRVLLDGDAAAEPGGTGADGARDSEGPEVRQLSQAYVNVELVTESEISPSLRSSTRTPSASALPFPTPQTVK